MPWHSLPSSRPIRVYNDERFQMISRLTIIVRESSIRDSVEHGAEHVGIIIVPHQPSLAM